MEELIAQVLYPSHPHAILIAALVNINWWTSHYSNILICVHIWFTVDCTWHPWGSWSSCSKTCGSGTMTHSRTQNGPFYGGSVCTGSSSESTSCNTNSCPGKHILINIPLFKYNATYECLQWIAHGTLGDLGAHVQRPAAQVPCLTQDPRMGHIMVEAIAQGHHLNQLHAMLIAVLVNIPKLQMLWNFVINWLLLIISVSYKIVSSGRNCLWITTVAECETAAAALGFTSTVASSSGTMSPRPPGCRDSGSGTNLWFNTDLGSTADCGTLGWDCLCKAWANDRKYMISFIDMSEEFLNC